MDIKLTVFCVFYFFCYLLLFLIYVCKLENMQYNKNKVKFEVKAASGIVCPALAWFYVSSLPLPTPFTFDPTSQWT